MIIRPDPPILARKSRASPWRTLLARAGAAAALLTIAFMLLWFDRDGLKDQIDGHISFTDTLYFTMITITTVGYGDIVPVSDRARLIDAFLITPIRLFVWLIFLGTAFDIVVRRSWQRWRMRQIQQNLCNHIVIAGFGRSGPNAAEELTAAGLDASKIVVIDCHSEKIERAKQHGFAAVQGDASDNDVLAAVNIDRAAALIVAAGRDDTSILIVLSAHALAPKLPIAVSIQAADNEDIARHAGATTVVNPVTVTGHLLAQAARLPATA